MIKKHTHLFIFLFLPLFSNTFWSQSTRKVDVKNFDQNLVHTLFLKHLNHHRDSLELSPLHPHTILNLAAKDQTDFMCTNHVLQHEQPKESKKGPSERVVYYRGNFNMVGENVLFTLLNTPIDTKEYSLFITNYEELAYALFLSWKYSPPHYKNMITPEYKFSGLQIGIDPTTNKIYSANVFGGEEYHAPTIFPKDYSVWHIKPDEKGLYEELANSTFAISTANFVYETNQNLESYTNNDSIATHYYDTREIKSIIKNPKDGIMLDFVIRDQFTCKSENILDFSPVYDGWPQEPVYTSAIYSNNKATNKNELDVNLNKIPTPLLGKDFQTNVILIKDNLSISYAVPLSVPQDEFDVMDFRPLIDQADLVIKDTSLTFHFTNRVYFHKGTDKPLEDAYYEESILNKGYLPKDAKIVNVEVVGFSSIEGDSVQNRKLQEKRVNYIRDYLLSVSSLKSNAIQTKTSENKADFYTDFKNTLKLAPNLSVSELNKIYIENKSKIDENILATHRYTELGFDLELSLNNRSTTQVLALIYAHIDELTPASKTKLLKVLLSKMQKDEDLFFVDPVDFRKLNNKNLLLPLYFYASDSVKFKEIYGQNKNQKNWNEKDKFNFVIANYKYYQTYSKVFIPLPELTANINLISKKTISDSVKNLLFLNFYLIKTKICYDTKNVPELKLALQKFKEYYFKFEQGIDDIIMIGLFFNNYAMCDWTLDLLKPKLNKYPQNTELWFTYLNTYTFNEYPDYDPEFLQMLITKCKKLNKAYFCNWINKGDYQLLRDDLIKKNYCFDCE